MIGKNRAGGFHTSPTATYPPGMCTFLAERIYGDFTGRKSATYGGDVAPPQVHRGPTKTRKTTTFDKTRRSKAGRYGMSRRKEAEGTAEQTAANAYVKDMILAPLARAATTCVNASDCAVAKDEGRKMDAVSTFLGDTL